MDRVKIQLLAAVLALSFSSIAQTAGLLDGTRINAGRLPSELKVKLNGHDIDLKKSAGLNALKQAVSAKIDKLNPEEDKKEIMFLKELLSLVEIAGSPSRPEADRQEALMMAAEIADTFQNEGRSPLPEKIDITFNAIFIAIEYFNNPFAEGGNGRATNLLPSDETDRSKVDPADSTFWANPGDIPAKEAYFGFARSALRDFSKPCNYKGPKDSLGAHAGFVMECGKDEVKIKFGEESSEPFGSRIFNLIGYNVEPTDFADDVRVTYDRKYFQEFNSRKPPVIKLSLAGIPLTKIPLFKFFDPLTFVKRLILKDGSSVEVDKIASFLLKTYSAAKPDFSDANFNAGTEALVAELVFRPANIQTKNKKLKSIGAWDWNRLEKDKRRDLRGMGMLAAWLNWFDARWDNTRLKILETPAGPQLKHFINDIGSVLGEASDFIKSESGEANRFPWTFTNIVESWVRVYPNREVPLRKVRKLTFEHFKMAYDDTDPFRDMTYEDALWMARRIARITEKQMRDALVASGFSSAESKIFLEKLISRRDRMILDLELDTEFDLLRVKPTSRKLNYNPETDGLVFGGPDDKIAAPSRGQKVENGVCVGCKTNYPILVIKRP